METTKAPQTSDAHKPLRLDSLAQSVVMLLIMTVVQRLVGLLRSVLLCRWLEPEQLGSWDVAFGFMTLFAPLAVLGLPGSFGRYVEYYRRQGQLRVLLSRTTWLSLVSAGVVGLVIVVGQTSFSQLIFGSADQGRLVVAVAAAMFAFAAHNFLGSLFMAVRLYRVVSVMQFLQSVLFAVFSLGMLLCWRTSAESIIWAFGLASAVASLCSAPWLRQVWEQQAAPTTPVAHGEFWSKLVPFAAWMWVTNLLTNLFEVVDRYMIVHFSGLDSTAALAEVGAYHSSRIIPVLLVSVSVLLASILTPHLSHDWELGRRDRVAARLRLVLKVLALGMLAAATAVLIVAPALFGVAFQSKFTAGLAVLPWTFSYCIWFALFPVVQNYLWCAEKARLASTSLLCGLLLNIGFNLLWLPAHGLHGAVWATAAANLLVLVLTYAFSRWQGLRLDAGTWLLTLSPLVLPLGLAASVVSVAVLVVVGLATDRLFNRAEKQELLAALPGPLQRWLVAFKPSQRSRADASELVEA